MDMSSQTISFPQARRDAVSIFLAKVFYWMAIGLALTAVVAWLTLQSGLLFNLVGAPLIVLFIAEIALVWYLSARVWQMSPGAATGCFLLYSLLNGLTLSVIFLVYTRTSIATTFLITAAMFAAMSLYGFITKRDLSGWGSFLFMGLIGIILASLVNIFLHSSSLYWTISVLGVLIFVGLTAYDVQKIKRMGEEGILDQGGDMIQRGAICGALSLYLDFINLFLMLLRLFGGSRN
ncbi:MAG: Bax inhibitor-1/YccA family protein [Desulfobulbaceae bacterium]|jgi:FtsH-binding integral membrane protein|nr:Bax inhibitor-1/YccA family protein [Desulfobulbaceae bacterium]